MSKLTEAQLVGLAADWVRENTPEADGAGAALSSETDLLATGLLDSLGFVQLIAYLEQEVGATIDLLEIDPNDFTRLGRLCASALDASEKDRFDE